ncbi:MAG: DUF5655 domain-containing protein, partial [Hyphomicrobium sp.]
RPLYENGSAVRKTARPRRAAAAPAAPPSLPPAPPIAAPPVAAVFPASPPPVAPKPSATVIPLRVVPKSPPPIPSPAPAAPPPPAQAHDLDTVLAKAKAFRPLANYVLTEIAKAVPASVAAPGAAHIVIAKDAKTFAVLAISAKELRLGLALGGVTVEAPYQAAKAASFPTDLAGALTHMAVLNDARQINDPLIARVREAADRVG